MLEILVQQFDVTFAEIFLFEFEFQPLGKLVTGFASFAISVMNRLESLDQVLGIFVRQIRIGTWCVHVDPLFFDFVKLSHGAESSVIAILHFDIFFLAQKFGIDIKLID